ncbi:MAG: hydroxyethylthiazole kinase, partial [Clostridia bacterium]|nr:hydroxyethylthiazole kinase [Clostridia bacterium]
YVPYRVGSAGNGVYGFLDRVSGEFKASVTGTGCMLGMLCGVYLSVCRDFRAAVTACAVLGISAELADAAPGSGSFMTGLLDRLSDLSDEDIERRLRIEEI